MSDDKQRARFVARLRRIVADAKAAGISLVADGTSASGGGVRVMTAEEARADDLRDVGICVSLHDGCGFSEGDSSGGGKWM